MTGDPERMPKSEGRAARRPPAQESTTGSALLPNRPPTPHDSHHRGAEESGAEEKQAARQRYGDLGEPHDDPEVVDVALTRPHRTEPGDGIELDDDVRVVGEEVELEKVLDAAGLERHITERINL